MTGRIGLILGLSLILTLLIAGLVHNRLFAQSSDVDVNLVLAIDCSYSVNASEYALQMVGTAQAFIDPVVVDAIIGGQYGAIAVTVVQWSRNDSQIVIVPWTRIANASDALRVAQAISQSKRRTAEGGTSISGMLKFGAGLLAQSPWNGTRNVIDIVADGENNSGERLEIVRDQLVVQGITINGLAILNEVIYLYHYMQNRLIGGQYAFAEQADNYEDFARAIHRKLLREIQGPAVS